MSPLFVSIQLVPQPMNKVLRIGFICSWSCIILRYLFMFTETHILCVHNHFYLHWKTYTFCKVFILLRLAINLVELTINLSEILTQLVLWLISWLVYKSFKIQFPEMLKNNVYYQTFWIKVIFHLCLTSSCCFV